MGTDVGAANEHPAPSTSTSFPFACDTAFSSGAGNGAACDTSLAMNIRTLSEKRHQVLSFDT
jgi:hypothetical protein